MHRPAVLSLIVCLALAPLHAQDTAKAQVMVKDAVAFAKKNGKDAFLKEVVQGTGKFHVQAGSDLYIFIYDTQGVCLAIGNGQPNVIGVNRLELKDPNGKFIVKEFIALAKSKGSGWVDYVYLNPTTKKTQDKTSYVEFLDGMIIGCGTYK